MKKRPILPNNFETESKLDEKDIEKARSAPEKDAKNARLAPETSSDVAAKTHKSAPSGPLEVEDPPQAEASRETPSPAPERPNKKRGPKTARGKKRISRNAIKHGILSPHPVVIAGLETIEEWEEFESEIAESWAPVGRYERELASDIAFGLWRLRRCRIQESAQISQQVEEVEAELQQADAYYDEDDEDDGALEDEQGEWPEVDPVRLRAHQHLNVIPDSWSIDRILRYETYVRRALLQTVHELEARQAHRQGERTPLARVAFSSGPSLRRPTVAGSSALQQINQDITLAKRGLAARKRARSEVPEFLAKDE